MQKLILSTAVALAATLAGSRAQALPAAPPAALAPGNLIEARSGCGLGWHLDPYGFCRRNLAPRAYGPYAVYAPPYFPARCWWTETSFGPRRVCAW